MLSEFLLEGIRELSVLKFYGREQSEQDTQREKGRERKGERVTATYSSVLSLSSSTGKPGFMADEDLTQFLIKQEFGFRRQEEQRDHRGGRPFLGLTSGSLYIIFAFLSLNNWRKIE